METNVKMALQKAKEDNRRTVVTYIYKYVNYKDSVALNNLLSVDLIKNNFKRTTLQNYLTGVRRYMTTGEKSPKVALAPYVYNIIDELKAKHYPTLTPPVDAKHKVYELKKDKKVATVNTTDITNTVKSVSNSVSISKGSYPQLVNLKNDVEFETVQLENKIKAYQEKAEENRSKLRALEVVMGMLK